MTFVDSCFLFLRVFKRICLQFASYKSLGHGASSRNHTRSSSSIKPSRRLSTASKNPRINDRVLIWSAVFIDCMILSAGCSCRKWFWHPRIYMHLLYSEVYPRYRKIVPAASHSKPQDICKPQCNEVCFPLQQGGWDENSNNPPAKTSRRMFYRACILIFFSNPWLAGICSNFLVSEIVFFWSICPELHGDMLIPFCVAYLEHVSSKTGFCRMQFFWEICIFPQDNQRKSDLLRNHLQSSALLHLHIARRVSVATPLRLATVWCSQWHCHWVSSVNSRSKEDLTVLQRSIKC